MIGSYPVIMVVIAVGAIEAMVKMSFDTVIA